jgi:hypothetical protein
MKKISLILSLFILAVFALPAISFAAQLEVDRELDRRLGGADGGVGSGNPEYEEFRLVPCDGVQKYLKDESGQIRRDSAGRPLVDQASKECDFNQLIIGFNRVVKFLLYLSIPLVLGMILFMGFKYITANGDPGKLASAKKMFVPVLLGLFWVFAAYIVVYTILDKLVADTIGGVPREDIIFLDVDN